MFHFSPAIDEGFGVSRLVDSRIFEGGKHEIEFGALGKVLKCHKLKRYH